MVLTEGIQITAFIGALIGVIVATLGPYYKAKKELGMNDMEIFFDRKFLKATIVAVILSAIAIGGSFPEILKNVNPDASYITTIVSSASLAIALNLGGNILLGPSLVTLEARQKAIKNIASQTMFKEIDNTINKLRSQEPITSAQQQQQPPAPNTTININNITDDEEDDCKCEKHKKDDSTVITP